MLPSKISLFQYDCLALGHIWLWQRQRAPRDVIWVHRQLSLSHLEPWDLATTRDVISEQVRIIGLGWGQGKGGERGQLSRYQTYYSLKQ